MTALNPNNSNNATGSSNGNGHRIIDVGGVRRPAHPIVRLTPKTPATPSTPNEAEPARAAAQPAARPLRRLVRDARGRFVFRAVEEAHGFGAATQEAPAERRPEARRPAAAGTTGQPGTAMALVRYLESSSSTEDLRAEAGQHLFGQVTTPRHQNRWLRRVLGATGIWTFGEDLHGRQAVTRGVRDQSHLPAQMLSASTLLDFVGSLGLFKFIFQSSPLGAFPPALVFSGLLLYLSHRSGGGMVNRLKSNGMASVSIAVFLAIATAQSLTTGVGVFLFSGQTKVVNHRAAELAGSDFERRRQRLASWRDPASNRLLLADLATCEQNMRRLDAVGANNPAYQQLSVETFGLWQDRRVPPTGQPRWVLQDWARERWPICPRAAANKADLERRIDGESRQLEELEQKLQEAPSAAAFLRQHQPQVFAEHFRVLPDGTVEMKDSLKAFGAAWDFFWSPPADSRSDLTLSMLLMWISIGTSTAAFLFLLRFSLKDETKMSFSEACGHHRAELLSELQRRLPDELLAHFRELEARERRQGLPATRGGVRLDEIDKLTPELQTLAHLTQTGDAEVQRLARQQYLERLVDLYVQRSNETGEIDYAYLAHRVTRYWADLKAAGRARVAPQSADHGDGARR
jgi:hypothetical protein